MSTVACFVSPHGFGHAARTCAVIEALRRELNQVRFHLFTTVPQWFFDESLPDCFRYHHCRSDIGLVQVSALEENLEATVAALDRAPWRDPEVVGKLAQDLDVLRCALVLADISPLGLRVARRAGLPSVLVENFTWDWIYANIDGPPALVSCGDELAWDFATADLRVQADPVCRTVTGAVGVTPVAREPRCSRVATRRRLGVPEDALMVLVSMGGVGWDYHSLDEVGNGEDVWVVVPGGGGTGSRSGRVLSLPFHSPLYHPDLVNAADVVVGKLGYSTVAEAAQAGAALAYVERPRFPESEVLARFVDRNLTSRKLDRREFESGEWLPAVRELLAVRRKASLVTDGAARAASVILDRFPKVLR